jgi:hypothetical protein
VSLLTPGSAKAKLAAAAYRNPEELPERYRDLHQANLLAEARRTVQRAIATGSAPPDDELIPALLDAIGHWQRLGGDG